jgi:chaperonin GroEL (HSP60 family)
LGHNHLRQRAWLKRPQQGALHATLSHPEQLPGWLNIKSCITSAQEEHENGNVVGLDVSTGEPLDPVLSGIYDNYLVKKQILQSSPIIASQLLLVDEVGLHMSVAV